mgnify:CR=1 FL=1
MPVISIKNRTSQNQIGELLQTLYEDVLLLCECEEQPIRNNTKAKEWLETLPSTLMRYTPTLIQGIQALKGNKVDYTNPNLIAANTRNINFTPLGDYMALERLPFVSTIGNKMQAQ